MKCDVKVRSEVWGTRLSDNSLVDVPAVSEDEAVEGVEGAEAGLNLQLLPAADHLTPAVEAWEDQQLPHQVEAWNYLLIVSFRN